jgi:hypothetical protein
LDSLASCPQGSLGIDHLEDLTVGARTAALHDPRFRECPADVWQFLTKPQYGSAEVAKALTEQLLQLSQGHFFQEATGLDLMPQGSLFPLVPHAQGHLGQSYPKYVLRGLRAEEPDYVPEPRRVPPEVTQAASGLLITQLNDSPEQRQP